MVGDLSGAAEGTLGFTIVNNGMTLQATTGKIIIAGEELSVDKTRLLYLPRTSKKGQDGNKLPSNTRMLIDYAAGTSHNVDMYHLDAAGKKVVRPAACTLKITKPSAAEVPRWTPGEDRILHRIGKTAAGGAGGGH